MTVTAAEGEPMAFRKRKRYWWSTAIPTVSEPLRAVGQPDDVSVSFQDEDLVVTTWNWHDIATTLQRADHHLQTTTHHIQCSFDTAGLLSCISTSDSSHNTQKNTFKGPSSSSLTNLTWDTEAPSLTRRNLTWTLLLAFNVAEWRWDATGGVSAHGTVEEVRHHLGWFYPPLNDGASAFMMQRNGIKQAGSAQMMQQTSLLTEVPVCVVISLWAGQRRLPDEKHLPGEKPHSFGPSCIFIWGEYHWEHGNGWQRRFPSSLHGATFPPASCPPSHLTQHG